jgi:hypothetical protein
VQGGNWRIFGSFLAEAEAKLHLATRVTQITSLHIKPSTNTSSSTAQFLLTSNDTSLNHSPALQEPFDAIFLASPFHQANISLSGEQLEGFGDAIPFVSLSPPPPLPNKTSLFNRKLKVHPSLPFQSTIDPSHLAESNLTSTFTQPY